MTLSDFASIGSFISGIAVLVSLAYLTIQVRQSDRNQRSLLVQQRTATGVEAMFHCAEPHLAEVLSKSNFHPANLSEVELVQYFSAKRALWIWCEDAFFHHRASLLDGLAFDSLVVGVKRDLLSPGTRAYWAMNRRGFSAEFVRFVEEQLKTVPIVPFKGSQARWREELAKVEAQAAA